MSIIGGATPRINNTGPGATIENSLKSYHEGATTDSKGSHLRENTRKTVVTPGGANSGLNSLFNQSDALSMHHTGAIRQRRKKAAACLVNQLGSQTHKQAISIEHKSEPYSRESGVVEFTAVGLHEGVEIQGFESANPQDRARSYVSHARRVRPTAESRLKPYQQLPAEIIVSSREPDTSEAPEVSPRTSPGVGVSVTPGASTMQNSRFAKDLIVVGDQLVGQSRNPKAYQATPSLSHARGGGATTQSGSRNESQQVQSQVPTQKTEDRTRLRGESATPTAPGDVIIDATRDAEIRIKQSGRPSRLTSLFAEVSKDTERLITDQSDTIDNFRLDPGLKIQQANKFKRFVRKAKKDAMYGEGSPFADYVIEQASYIDKVNGARVARMRDKSPLNLIRQVKRVEAIQERKLKKINDQKLAMEQVKQLSDRNSVGLCEAEELKTWLEAHEASKAKSTVPPGKFNKTFAAWPRKYHIITPEEEVEEPTAKLGGTMLRFDINHDSSNFAAITAPVVDKRATLELQQFVTTAQSKASLGVSDAGSAEGYIDAQNNHLVGRGSPYLRRTQQIAQHKRPSEMHNPDNSSISPWVRTADGGSAAQAEFTPNSSAVNDRVIATIRGKESRSVVKSNRTNNQSLFEVEDSLLDTSADVSALAQLKYERAVKAATKMASPTAAAAGPMATDRRSWNVAGNATFALQQSWQKYQEREKLREHTSRLNSRRATLDPLRGDSSNRFSFRTGRRKGGLEATPAENHEVSETLPDSSLNQGTGPLAVLVSPHTYEATMAQDSLMQYSDEKPPHQASHSNSFVTAAPSIDHSIHEALITSDGAMLVPKFGVEKQMESLQVDLRKLHAQQRAKQQRDLEASARAEAHIRLSNNNMSDITPRQRTVTTDEQANMIFSLVGTAYAFRASERPSVTTRREVTPGASQPPLSPVPVPRLRIEAAKPRVRHETSLRRDTMMNADTTEAKDGTVRAEDSGGPKADKNGAELTLLTQQNEAADSGLRISNRDQTLESARNLQSTMKKPSLVGIDSGGDIITGRTLFDVKEKPRLGRREDDQDVGGDDAKKAGLSEPAFEVVEKKLTNTSSAGNGESAGAAPEAADDASGSADQSAASEQRFDGTPLATSRINQSSKEGIRIQEGGGMNTVEAPTRLATLMTDVPENSPGRDLSGGSPRRRVTADLKNSGTGSPAVASVVVSQLGNHLRAHEASPEEKRKAAIIERQKVNPAYKLDQSLLPRDQRQHISANPLRVTKVAGTQITSTRTRSPRSGSPKIVRADSGQERSGEELSEAQYVVLTDGYSDQVLPRYALDSFGIAFRQPAVHTLKVRSVRRDEAAGPPSARLQEQQLKKMHVDGKQQLELTELNLLKQLGIMPPRSLNLDEIQRGASGLGAVGSDVPSSPATPPTGSQHLLDDEMAIQQAEEQVLIEKQKLQIVKGVLEKLLAATNEIRVQRKELQQMAWKQSRQVTPKEFKLIGLDNEKSPEGRTPTLVPLEPMNDLIMAQEAAVDQLRLVEGGHSNVLTPVPEYPIQSKEFKASKEIILPALNSLDHKALLARRKISTEVIPSAVATVRRRDDNVSGTTSQGSLPHMMPPVGLQGHHSSPRTNRGHLLIQAGSFEAKDADVHKKIEKAGLDIADREQTITLHDDNHDKEQNEQEEAQVQKLSTLATKDISSSHENLEHILTKRILQHYKLTQVFVQDTETTGSAEQTAEENALQQLENFLVTTIDKWEAGIAARLADRRERFGKKQSKSVVRQRDMQDMARGGESHAVDLLTRGKIGPQLDDKGPITLEKLQTRQMRIRNTTARFLEQNGLSKLQREEKRLLASKTPNAGRQPVSVDLRATGLFDKYAEKMVGTRYKYRLEDLISQRKETKSVEGKSYKDEHGLMKQLATNNGTESLMHWEKVLKYQRQMRWGTQGTAGVKDLNDRKFLKEVRGYKAGLGPAGTTIEKDVVDVFDRLLLSSDAHWTEKKMGQLAKNVLIRKDVLTAQRMAEEPLAITASTGSRGNKIRFSTLAPMQSANCVTPNSTEDPNAAAMVPINVNALKNLSVRFVSKSRSSSASRDHAALPATPISKMSALKPHMVRTQPGRVEAAVQIHLNQPVTYTGSLDTYTNGYSNAAKQIVQMQEQTASQKLLSEIQNLSNKQEASEEYDPFSNPGDVSQQPQPSGRSPTFKSEDLRSIVRSHEQAEEQSKVGSRRARATTQMHPHVQQKYLKSVSLAAYTASSKSKKEKEKKFDGLNGTKVTLAKKISKEEQQRLEQEGMKFARFIEHAQDYTKSGDEQRTLREQQTLTPTELVQGLGPFVHTLHTDASKQVKFEFGTVTQDNRENSGKMRSSDAARGSGQGVKTAMNSSSKEKMTLLQRVASPIDRIIIRQSTQSRESLLEGCSPRGGQMAVKVESTCKANAASQSPQFSARSGHPGSDGLSRTIALENKGSTEQVSLSPRQKKQRANDDLGRLTPLSGSKARAAESTFNLARKANDGSEASSPCNAESLPSFATAPSKYRRPILGGGFDCNQADLAIAIKQEKQIMHILQTDKRHREHMKRMAVHVDPWKKSGARSGRSGEDLQGTQVHLAPKLQQVGIKFGSPKQRASQSSSIQYIQPGSSSKRAVMVQTSPPRQGQQHFIPAPDQRN